MNGFSAIVCLLRSMLQRNRDALALMNIHEWKGVLERLTIKYILSLVNTQQNNANTKHDNCKK